MTRPFITVPADQPSYEDILDMTAEQISMLSPRFHTPEWMDSVPGLFVCRVCWGDGWATAWPCPTSLAHGREVFGPERFG